MRSGLLWAMLPRRERRGRVTVESKQVDRAEGPKRERSVPVLSSYQREAFKRGQVARSGQERQADRGEGSRGEKWRTSRGYGQLLGLWLRDLRL